MNRLQSTAIIVFALSLVMEASPALASDEAEITFRYGDTPGVIAEAQTFTPADTTEFTDYTTNPTDMTDGQGESTYAPVGTYSPADVPERDAFSAGYLDVPNPCIRRRIGGNYCEPSAPSPGSPVDGGNPRREGPPAPSPEEIARTAVDRAISLAPNPELKVAPGRIGLTGLDSYFWLAEPPTTVTASAGVPGLTVVARAVPSQFVWDFGDGEDLVSASSGSKWTPNKRGGISHLYETKGTYDLTIDVIWTASYSINGGAWTPIGHFSTSDARTYPVQEMVAVLVEG